MSTPDTLRLGELIRYEGRIYRVDLVNDSRARCVPLSGRVVEVVGEEGETREFESLGRPINISPTSFVDRVDDDELTVTENRRLLMATAAAIPVATKKAKTPLQKMNEERKARLAAKKAAAPPKAPREKKEKVLRECVCGCGGSTAGYFVQGHDARFKGWMIQVERGKMEVKDLPKAVQKAFEFKKVGQGFRTTRNYKGEPHNGYDKKG